MPADGLTTLPKSLGEALNPSGDDDRLMATDPPLNRLDFKRRALTLAAQLEREGVARVGLWFEDAVLLGLALLACWRSGAVAILPADVKPGTLAAIDPDVSLWLTDTRLDLPSTRCRSIDGSAHHLDRRLDDGLDYGPNKRLSENLSEPVGELPPLPATLLDLDAAGVILQTSGSSGTPKYIHKTWRQLNAEAHTLAIHWPPTDTPLTVLGSVSAQHLYGLTFRVLWPLCVGAIIDRPQRAFPEALLHESVKQAHFCWITSPALLRRLTPTFGWQALKPGLTRVFSSGGPLPVAVSRTFSDASQCTPTEIYGSSETGAVAWREGDNDWQPLPSVSIGTHPDGLVWIASPWASASGLLHKETTGDAIELTPNGRFRLLGRRDRIVKIEEKRVSLTGVEAMLGSHEWVDDCRVGQQSGHARLSALVALSARGQHRLRNGGKRAVIQALRDFLSAQGESLACPRYWRFFRELPYNAQGKLTQADFQAAIDQQIKLPEILTHSGVNEDNGIRHSDIRIAIPLNLACLAGHFVDTPIVPGVVQIGWAETLARPLHKGIDQSQGIEALKFARVMRPGDELDLSLRWDIAKNRLTFEYRSALGTSASGRLMYVQHG